MKFEVIRSNRKSMTIEIEANKLIIRAPRQATNEGQVSGRLIGALAAGNCCVLKPSAYSPAPSAAITSSLSVINPPANTGVRINAHTFRIVFGITPGKISTKSGCSSSAFSTPANAIESITKMR